MLTQVLRATPRPLILASACFFATAYFALRFPDVPGAGAGSYVSTFIIALPSLIAFFKYLGPRRAALSLLALSAFGYAIEAIGVATGLPYGSFYYGAALGPKLLGLVPYLLPISYAPLVIGAVAASWNGSSESNHRLFVVFRSALLLVLMDGVLDPGAAHLGFWVWPAGGAYYGVPASNYAGWLLSGALATALLLAIGRWRSPPLPGMLDGAILVALFAYLLHRRSRLRLVAKRAPGAGRV